MAALESAVMPGENAVVTPLRAGREKGRRHSRYAYLKFVLLNQWHCALLIVAMGFGVACQSVSLTLVAIVCAEGVALGVFPRTRAFRGYADECSLQLKRSRAATLRARLLVQMDEEHRRELERLELIVDRMRSGEGDRPVPPAAVDECLRLLAGYVRLAITYKVGSQTLARTDRKALDTATRALEAMRSSSNSQTAEIVERRLAVVRRRAQRWDRSREALEALIHQLALTGELVQLTHEEVLAPIDTHNAARQMDRVVDQIDESNAAFQELAEFVGIDEVIEPRMLDMGRALRA